MANAFYTKGKEKVLNGDIDWDTDTIKASLVKNTYAQNLTTDEFYTSISSYILNSDKALTTKVITGGVFDADDITYSAVTAGDVAEAIVIWKDTGVAGTSPLLIYIDTITGFPITTNGGDITIQWDNGGYKIFSL